LCRHGQAQDTSGDRCEQDRLVGEQPFSRKYGDDFRDNPDRRQQHDIDLRVPKNQNRCCHKMGSPPPAGSKNVVPRVWPNNNMTAPAIKGPAEGMKTILAMTIIQMTIGISVQRMPGAREFMTVTMKLMPPNKNAMNSSITARSYRVAPQGVK
jgi:hypothetical protein